MLNLLSRFFSWFAVCGRRGVAPLLAVASLTAITTGSGLAADFLVVDESGQPVPDAVVYFDGPGSSNAASESSLTYELGQRDKTFVPHVLAIRVGSDVEFTNQDPINHHVYSFSKPRRFSLKLKRNEPLPPRLHFDKPGVVILGCNIHDWMLAYIYVVETSSFTTTDHQGFGSIATADDDAVVEEVLVWHPRLKGAPLKRVVNLSAGRLQVTVPELLPDPKPGVRIY